MNDKPISGFGLAPIKGEGMIADPDEYEWKCDCAKCEERYRHWKNDFDVQQAALRNEALDKKAENARELGLDYEPVQDWKWHQAPVKTSWGHDMVVADLAIDKDNTVSVYCERDQTAKVEAMFTPPAAPDLQAELDATNRQVEILSDALAESRREVAALAAPVHKPLHPEIKKMYEDYFDKCFRESSAEVPENFMDALMFDTAVRDVDAMIALARADERESCAKVCDRMAARCNDIRAAALESAAENIRARGQK